MIGFTCISNVLPVPQCEGTAKAKMKVFNQLQILYYICKTIHLRVAIKNDFMQSPLAPLPLHLTFMIIITNIFRII